MIATCPCGKEFKTSKSRVDTGRGRYCSKKCMYEYRVRPSGLKYTLTKENPTSFKKGNIPWCTGTVGVMKAWNKGTKGVMKPNSTSFKKGEVSGENNLTWKGDAVGYAGLHSWVRRNLGKAKDCFVCGKEDRVEWANISHQYLRDVKDFVALCHRCHSLYDRLDYGAIKRRYGEKRR